MPEDEEIADNVLRLIADAVDQPAEDIDLEASVIDDLGFSRKSLLDLAYAINRDEYFKPLGVGLIPDDVADCETVDEIIALVEEDLSYDRPARREKKQPPKK